MLTDNPYASSRNNLPLMRYQITQTHEVLIEFVSHISSFVTRNYVYTDKAIPEEIKKLEDEAQEIKRSFSLSDTREVLNKHEVRLVEIDRIIKDATPLPHR